MKEQSNDCLSFMIPDYFDDVQQEQNKNINHAEEVNKVYPNFLKKNAISQHQDIIQQLKSLTQSIQYLSTKIQPNQKQNDWSEYEHQLFIHGISKYGKQNLQLISPLIPTKSLQQLVQHRQKFYLRLERKFTKQRPVPKDDFVRLIGIINALDNDLIRSTLQQAKKYNGLLRKAHCTQKKVCCRDYQEKVENYDMLFMMRVAQNAIQFVDECPDYKVILQFLAQKYKISQELVLFMIYNVFFKVKDQQMNEQLVEQQKSLQNCPFVE